MEPVRTLRLPSGQGVPALGLGTWRMAEDRSRRADEIATIQLAVDSGASLIDTAEMYGEGRAEELIGEALQGRRERAFLVSKVYPHNASRRGAVAACERSLKRLRTDRIDLYLLHWRGDIPLHETLDAFMQLQQSGKIRAYGVSNFDRADMEEVWPLPGGSGIATNQVLYNLSRRGVEWALLPWLRQHRVPMMAYSPIEQGRLLANPKLTRCARDAGVTPAQMALAWLLNQEDLILIPKTSRPERFREALGALQHRLTPDQLAELEQAFPAPSSPRSLEML